MIKIMIVDDEPIVRIRLRETIDWNSIGCEIAAEASDGIGALRLYAKCKPDIIITDIMMNNGDGLELISTIRNKDKYVEFIILTGYEDFNFAKTALENEVGAYILKPIQNDVIIKYVEVAKAKLSKKLSKIQSADKSPDEEWLAKIVNFLDTTPPGNDEIEKFLEKNNIIDDRGYYTVAIIVYDDKNDDDASRVLTETIKYSANINKVRAVTKRISASQYVLLALCSGDDEYERFENMIFVISQQYKKYTNNFIKTSISGMIHNVTLLLRVYKSMLDETVGSISENKNLNAKNEDKTGNKDVVDEAVKYIHQHYKDVSVEKLAAKLFVSKRTLMRKFKNQTGKTVGEFIIETRIYAAVELIKTGRYKIIEAAYKVGYSDMKYFSKTFKKITGHTPKFYKHKRGVDDA